MAREGSRRIGWSVTRARTLQSCPRRYWFQYYLAPRGKGRPRSDRAGLARLLKGLQTLPMWRGSVVHDTLAHVLNCWWAGRDVSPEEAEQYAAVELKRQARRSWEYWHEDPDDPDAHPPALLDTHYYNTKELTPERARGVRVHVQGAVRAFMHSDLAARIRALPRDDRLPIERFARTTLDDAIPIIVKPDLAYREDGRLRILDWKTGKPDPVWNDIQLVTYAFYAREKWHREGEILEPRLVLLQDPIEELPFALDEEIEIRVREAIYSSYGAMLRIVSQAGVQPAEKWFAVTEVAKECCTCPFRGICDDRPGGSETVHSTGTRRVP